MGWVNLVLALHLLGAVIWVGGMAFALLVLRPALAALEPAARMALHVQVFRRFFLYVWHAMPIMLLTGYIMLATLGGFAGANWAVHTMNLLGLIMAVVFLYVFFVPWRALRVLHGRGDLRGAEQSVTRIRGLIRVNLILGLVTVAIAAWGG